MIERNLKVNNKTGLHARPASELAALCMTFKSDITLLTPTAKINPKSIVSILSGGVYQGTEVLLRVGGSDELEAADAIEALIRNLTD